MTGRSASGVVRALSLTVLATACSAPRTVQEDSPSTSVPIVGAGRAADTTLAGLIARLEREARALARTDGCTAADACRAAPVGAKACGGPRGYIVYCARTTDSVALFRKLDSLRAAEDRRNRESGVMSTCEAILPPQPTVREGRCQAY